jgi:hypothetical protein
MPLPTPPDLKKTLLTSGFEVYRTLADRVVLAERVRDNLIMDSGVAAGAADGLFVLFVVRAQGNDFPSESRDQLMVRARALATDAVGRGYTELATAVVPIHDPGERTRTLDTWYEVTYRKPVADEIELVDELKYALALNKTVSVSRQ